MNKVVTVLKKLMILMIMFALQIAGAGLEVLLGRASAALLA